MSWKYRTVTAPYELNQDPTLSESKINTHRWSGFVFDLKNESIQMRRDMERTASLYSQVNDDFKVHVQQSFNAIHNVKRVKPTPDTGIPRVSRQSRARTSKTSKAPKRRQFHQTFLAGFDDETKDANHDRWPVRTSSALRYLRPSRLRSIYDVEPKKRDLYVVSGELVDDVDDV